jgi:hypothetical protein
MVSKNTANAFGGEFLEPSFHDLLHPHVETKSAAEIVEEVAARAGITII